MVLPCFRLDLRSNGVGLLGCKALSSLLKDRNASINKLSMAGNAADNMILEVRRARRLQPQHAHLDCLQQLPPQL